VSGGGPIPGWTADPAQAAGGDAARRSISARLSEGWLVYRAHPWPLLTVAILFQGVLGLPALVMSMLQQAAVLRFLGGESFVGLTDMEALWSIGPFDDLARNYAFLGAALGLSYLGYLLSVATVTALMLAEPAATWRLGPAIRAALARGIEFVGVGLVAMAVLVAAYWAQGSALARQLDDPVGSMRSDPLGPFAASLALLALEIALVYLMVRWIAAPGVMVLEDRPLRAALRRSSELTRGRRRWIAGVLLGGGIVVAVVILIALYVPAFIAGSILGWAVWPTYAVLALAALIAPVAITPFIAVVLAGLYRDLRDVGPLRPTVEPAVPGGWGSTT